MNRLSIANLALLLVSTCNTVCGQQSDGWIARYNGPANGIDMATCLAVDSSGCVYVTGLSLRKDENNYDYLTIRYLPNGDTAWVRRYNGPADHLDVPRRLVIDNQASTYVTGTSVSRENFLDFARVKYSCTGEQLWVRRNSGGIMSLDAALDLAIDSTSSVYVTGLSLALFDEPAFELIKYSSQGDSLWSQKLKVAGRFDKLVENSVVTTDAVYLAGYYFSEGNWNRDIMILKYSLFGKKLWSKRYWGSGMGNDRALALTVDPQGNPIVTGESYNGKSMDFVTIKYNPKGDSQWVRLYDGVGKGTDRSLTITSDRFGNVIVGGCSQNPDPSSDITIIKYTNKGETVWIKTYTGCPACKDSIVALTVDEAGDIYLTGTSWNGDSDDIITIKYSAMGIEQWVRFYDGPANSYDWPSDIAVDKNDYVYVTGTSVGESSGYDYVTIKYPPEIAKPESADEPKFSD